MKVFLNPGHAPNGHPDPGAVNEETGLRESDVALAVGKSAASYLPIIGVNIRREYTTLIHSTTG